MDRYPQLRNASWLRQHMATVAATVIPFVAPPTPVLKTGLSGDASHRPNQAHIMPGRGIPSIVPEPDEDQAFNAALGTYEQTGYGVVVAAPNTRDENRYSLHYLHAEGKLPLSSSSPPPLQEVVKVRDDNAFSWFTNYVGGFAIYNATKEPVDIPFVRYITESLNSWATHHPDGVNISEVMTAKVKPRESIYNSVFLVPNLPPSTYHKGPGKAYTATGKYATSSWIDFNSKRTRRQRYRGLATELCQALVKVYDPHTLLGETGAEEALQQDSSNPKARTNQRLLAQEVVCNSMGRVLTASYLGGIKGLDRLVEFGNSTVGLEGTQKYDYTLGLSQLGYMMALRNYTIVYPGTAYTVDGSTTPTVRRPR